MFNVVNGVEVTTSKANCDYIRKISREFTAGMSVVSTPSTPRSVRNYHRGNGSLRGGGIQKIYSTGPSMKVYKRKLDRRLGVCIFACLSTIATVLFIYGIFHETPHEELTAYITAIKEIVLESLPPSTTATPNMDVLIQQMLVTDNESDIYSSSPLIEPDTCLGSEEVDRVKCLTVPELQTDFELMHGVEMLVTDNESDIYSSSPLIEPDTCLGSEEVDRVKCLTVPELQTDFELMHGSHIVLWNLVALNVIIAMFLLPLTCIFYSERMQKNGNYKIFYRVALFLALFFMAAQLIFLISPLLTSAYYYPSMADKLLIYKLPRDQNLINNLESRFGCQFDYIQQLVELSIQEPCLPKIKNLLLPTYAVLLLIFIDLLPFAFIIFTYAWDAWIKDTSLCSGARRRIELNNQQRPQSREDILKRTMEEPQYV
ncbi:hypothetical protein Tcan_07111 [Toxocara canis]|uniref:Uncharacterized protein n=1 Tax=Toxocara canis TaxID=6265 RepID=A0A0B2VET7_TOXCA|nr:hypothetical protein Tcan_07111 [Toxocara canis]